MRNFALQFYKFKVCLFAEDNYRVGRRVQRLQNRGREGVLPISSMSERISTCPEELKFEIKRMYGAAILRIKVSPQEPRR